MYKTLFYPRTQILKLMLATWYILSANLIEINISFARDTQGQIAYAVRSHSSHHTYTHTKSIIKNIKKM